MSKTTPLLLVEDDEVDVEAVQRALTKAGVGNALRVARDGVEALEALGQGEAARASELPVLLLDINMPRMNGFELLARLRADAAMKDGVVFMLTTSSREADVRTAYGYNVAGYFLKDDLDRFVALLGRYLDVAQLPER